MKTNKWIWVVIVFLLSCAANASINYDVNTISATLSLKKPGCHAVDYPLKLIPVDGNGPCYQMKGETQIPVQLHQTVEYKANGRIRITLHIAAQEDIYFNYGQTINTGFSHEDCQFFMPGFWYRRNLRSPQGAPSFHESKSWIVREDRLSSPLTAVFNETCGKALSVARIIPPQGYDALTPHRQGEVILSGNTTLGHIGFIDHNGKTCLAFGFPYKEEPKSYIRKLTLAPPVKAFQYLAKGENVKVSWELSETDCTDYSECVKKIWEYAYDMYKPQPVLTPYSTENMKKVLSNYFVESFVDKHDLKYFSGVEIDVNTCHNTDVAEVGFIGRTLLNAFNALEYGEANGRTDLTSMANAVFDSYLRYGFSDVGLFKEVIKLERNYKEPFNSIRRQSEGAYAVLYYLNYEKRHGRMHKEWEKRIKRMLDIFLQIQNQDGSFPRKFNDDLSLVDKSGGSTPSATLPLVMGYKYFKDKRYLEAARRSVAYLEREIISKADYFSSTLDANCEDKEASLYACTAAYYLALVSSGKDVQHYASLAQKAAYFTLSWYYTWDVPFAQGQMLGDIGLKSRGWGNVSVENNHIDVFVFDFADVLHWLARIFNEKRFEDFAELISSSMRQLLPHEGHMCGVGKSGYYPEVVQHTNWDYGTGGKGFYNYIFAPGWTVASLWELYSPGRAELFLK